MIGLLQDDFVYNFKLYGETVAKFMLLLINLNN